MAELQLRRKRFFKGASFKSALFYSGDEPGALNANFQYFSGCSVDGTYLLLKPGSGLLLAHEMNYRAAKSVSSYPVKLLGKDRANDLRRACGNGKIGIAAGEMTFARASALRKKAKLKLVEADGKAYEVRGRKDADELKLLAQSAKIARRILDRLDPWESKTELELAANLKIAALEAGAKISFEPIVATGRNASFPHHNATAKKLGDAVLVDFGVRYKGYCSDFTRCYYKRKGMKEAEAYEKCQGIFWKLLELLDDCENGKEVSAVAESLMRKKGLPRLIHSVGHGIGLEVHEYPHLGKKSEDLLDGAVLALEPAAYFSKYGVRFEEMAAHTKKGGKLL